MCFLIKTLNNKKKKKNLLLSYTNTQWVLKSMISPYNLGEGSAICAKAHSYQNFTKIENGTRIVKYSKDLNQV